MLLLITAISCNSSREKNTDENLIHEFFHFLNGSEIFKALELVDENVKVTDGEFEIAKSKEELYGLLQWDSVFHPNFEILALTQEDSSFMITMRKSCYRISFLNESPIEYIFEIQFHEDLISKMSTIKYTRADFDLWGKKMEKLVKWAEETHPEWKGFQRDLTKEGAIIFSRAIEQYSLDKPGPD